MDRRNNRKSSWDSKMSVSTVSTGPRHYRRSPSSILSSDSDIRFTRRKLSQNCRCGCCILACFLTLLLLAAAALYVGYTFFVPEAPEEQIFRAMFRVVDGDSYSPELADPSTDKFRVRSRDYRERLNLLFRRSGLRPGFVKTEILALDGTENKDLVVHFNVHIDPRYGDVEADDLIKLLQEEIALEESIYFKDIKIDSSSLFVKENYSGVTPTTTQPSTRSAQSVTLTPAPPRRCSPLQLAYCNRLPYNITTYPNFLGHKSIKEVENDVIAFRELVDAECYRLAYDFVCQLLQPACRGGIIEDEMVLPCRSFCRDFMQGCGSRLLPRFKDILDCGRFPEFSGANTCRPKPECIQEMHIRALSPRICDGVIDCQDLADERTCSYCPVDHIHCGIGRACIPPTSRCDGKRDCPDGSDERACLNLSPSIEHTKKAGVITPHQHRYQNEGFVIFNEKGEMGKLCVENLNKSYGLKNDTEPILRTVATSLCNTLTYKNLVTVKTKDDKEMNIPYVSMKDPTASEITFVRTNCDSRKVLYVGCSDLECGIQSAQGRNGVIGLGKMSEHGDWPWHAALFKEDVHVCDATLVSPEWLVTTASCFQGQPKAEWTARLGTVRLSGTSPWQQERRIVGMVKSPVEGSTVAMIKLEEPVTMSDFVRPICLPKENAAILSSNLSNCNTLGWARNREQLQRVQLKLSLMERCENVSIATVNSLCTEAAYSRDDCNEEELAGSPMLCLLPDGQRWSLIGVTNWRIACSKSGVDRPRMYDKITSNVDWIHETISAIS